MQIETAKEMLTHRVHVQIAQQMFHHWTMQSSSFTAPYNGHKECSITDIWRLFPKHQMNIPPKVAAIICTLSQSSTLQLQLKSSPMCKTVYSYMCQHSCAAVWEQTTIIRTTNHFMKGPCHVIHYLSINILLLNCRTFTMPSNPSLL